MRYVAFYLTRYPGASLMQIVTSQTQYTFDEFVAALVAMQRAGVVRFDKGYYFDGPPFVAVAPAWAVG
jgi:hypothetical protein